MSGQLFNPNFYSIKSGLIRGFLLCVLNVEAFHHHCYILDGDSYHMGFLADGVNVVINADYVNKSMELLGVGLESGCY